MAKKLIIIESPGKISKFSQYLSKDYTVLASVGHVMDLPSNKLGVNIKKDFGTDFEVIDGKEQVIKNIIKEAKESEVVYMMTDADREGEGICWYFLEGCYFLL